MINLCITILLDVVDERGLLQHGHEHELGPLAGGHVACRSEEGEASAILVHAESSLKVPGH